MNMARRNAKLFIRQQPARAQVVQENNPKNRKPIDPPPIVELKFEGGRDNDQWLVSPRTFMMVTLIDPALPDDPNSGKNLIGQTVSSLHRLKDATNKDGGFFVFGDVSAKKIGKFILRFSLFDSSKEPDEVAFLASVDSDPFSVLVQRDFGSMSESTALTRTFSDQGVKLRVRKDNRTVPGIGTKRPYNTSPDESSSPVHHGMYGGGAVQDQQYGTTTPEIKRQRVDSDFAQSNMYQGLPMTDNTMPHYGTIPSSTRQWGNDDAHSRSTASYSHPSPMNTHMMGSRLHNMNLASSHTWQGLQSSSNLPSPPPSVSTYTSSYPSVSSQAQTSPIFQGAGSHHSMPRQFYGANYSFPGTSHYETHDLVESNSQYPEPPGTGTSVVDSGGLDSTHNYGNAHYHVFGSGANEHNGVYQPFVEGPSH